MITPKEKAEQLISNFSPFVYCYLGSGMLTNTEDDEVIKINAKKCALITVDEIILEYGTYYKVNIDDKYVSYCQEVKQEIEKL